MAEWLRRKTRILAYKKVDLLGSPASVRIWLLSIFFFYVLLLLLLLFFLQNLLRGSTTYFVILIFFFIIVLTFSAGEKGRSSCFIGVHCDASTDTPVALPDPGYLVINRITCGHIIKDRGRRLASPGTVGNLPLYESRRH